MKRKRTKIVIGVLLVMVGLPATLVAAILGWGYLSDKTNGSIVSSGVTRRYLLYVPKTYDRSKATPLVISIHPGATWPALQMAISRWNDVADEHGFIVVYPAGTGAFLGGLGPGPQIWPGGPRTLPRDTKFISDLIEKLEAEYNIDLKRIYVNGMSNGGAMAFALGCELPDRIAAVGAVAPANPPIPGERGCEELKPLPTVVFHGTADALAPFKGGKSPVAPRLFPNIPDWVAQVARRHQCKGDPSNTPITASVHRLTYTNCADNADVILYTVEGGGHTWPGGKPFPRWMAGHTTSEINASGIMWDFFVQHPREPK
jgi:polyhydroxybutyrate depolymerase